MIVYDNDRAGNDGTIVTSITALPDMYGLSPEDLVRLMNQWRERALQAKS